MRLKVLSIFQDCSFPAYFYTQPMATGPGFYDNLCPQSWQDGSAATWTLQDPHQQSKNFFVRLNFCSLLICIQLSPSSLRLPGQLNVGLYTIAYFCSACTIQIKKGTLRDHFMSVLGDSRP